MWLANHPRLWKFACRVSRSLTRYVFAFNIVYILILKLVCCFNYSTYVDKLLYNNKFYFNIHSDKMNFIWDQNWGLFGQQSPGFWHPGRFIVFSAFYSIVNKIYLLVNRKIFRACGPHHFLLSFVVNEFYHPRMAKVRLMGSTNPIIVPLFDGWTYITSRIKYLAFICLTYLFAWMVNLILCFWSPHFSKVTQTFTRYNMQKHNIVTTSRIS